MSPRFFRSAALLLLALPLAASAGEPVLLDFGRYLAKYPAMYATLSYADDARDAIYDADGNKQSGVAPTYGRGSRFPERRADVQFEWFFPFFETEALPFISSRLWTARATLGYARPAAKGPIADYAASHELRGAQSGITDIALQFGPVLYGSADWRTRSDTPLSVLLLGELSLPVGRRDPDAAVNAGSNVFSYGATLGAYWRPIAGVLVDGGAHWRAYSKNDEPAFDAQEPSHLGSLWSLDATLAVRIWRSLYASGSYYDARGADDEYNNVRASAHPQPATMPLMDSFPAPGTFRDAGTRDRRAAAAIHWFALQRLRLSLHYVLPLSGRSGEFDLPYEQQLQDCVALPTGCSPSANGSDHVDGLGGARVYASRYFLLSATWNFGQGDFWLSGP